MSKKINTIIIILLLVCIGYLLFVIYQNKKENQKNHFLSVGRAYKTTYETFYSPNIPAGFITLQGKVIFSDGKRPEPLKGVKQGKQEIYTYPDLNIEIIFPNLSKQTKADGKINFNQIWISTLGRFEKMPDEVELRFTNPGYQTAVCRIPINENYTILPDIVLIKKK